LTKQYMAVAFLTVEA